MTLLSRFDFCNLQSISPRHRSNRDSGRVRRAVARMSGPVPAAAPSRIHKRSHVMK